MSGSGSKNFLEGFPKTVGVDSREGANQHEVDEILWPGARLALAVGPGVSMDLLRDVLLKRERRDGWGFDAGRIPANRDPSQARASRSVDRRTQYRRGSPRKLDRPVRL